MGEILINRSNFHTADEEEAYQHGFPCPKQTFHTKDEESPSWYSPETGIYSSLQKSRILPQNPLQDVVSFVFSHEHKGVTAVVDSSTGSSLSYLDLRYLVRSMASGLHQIGISKNQVVLIMLPNTIFFPVIYFGLLSVGAIVSTMNPLSSPEEIMKRVNHCHAVLAFAFSESAEKFEKSGIRVVVTPGDLKFLSSEFLVFRSLISSDPAHAPMPAIRQSDTAALLYSSGTSGMSKGVVITHQNLIAMVELFVRFEASQYQTAGCENVYLAAIPMFHVYGLSLFTTGLFSIGAVVVLMTKFDAEEAVRAIDRYKVTHIPIVPPILTALVRASGSCASNLKSLRQVQCGAAPVSEKNIREFLQRFPHVDFIQGYGMTETTAVGTRGFNTERIKRHTSAGLLAPNMQAKVVNWIDGTCLPPGNSGELWIRGPAVMKGYLNDEKATLLTLDKNGWLRTGDIAYFDLDGYLHVLDRLKETIKYNGYQIAPADLEALLIDHPEILDVAVTAESDEDAGEIPVAFVVRKPGSMLSATGVIKYVAEQVAPYKKVRKVVFVPSIPRSAAGKTLRRLLRKSCL